MKKLLGILVLGLLLSSNAYAFFIKTGRENLVIVTDPPGAICELKNNKGTWSVLTPDKIKVKRSKQALKITCTKDEYKKFTRSYNLRDPKTFDYDYDLALSTGATIGSAASGDIFDLDFKTIVLNLIRSLSFSV